MIDKIEGLGNITPAGKTQKIRKAEQTSKSGRVRGDSIQLSDEAVKRAEFDKARNVVRSIEDIRKEKVESAKEKLKNGELYRKEVFKKVADIIAKDLTAIDRIEEIIKKTE